MLNLRSPLATLPKVEGYAVTQVDDTTLEVEVSKEQDINALFASLSKAGVHVLSMRNKANRLEELFVRLTEHKGAVRMSRLRYNLIGFNTIVYGNYAVCCASGCRLWCRQ